MTVATLDLDIGNSRVKWRYLHHGGRVERGAFDRIEGWLDPRWDRIRPRRIRVSSVAGLLANKEFRRAVALRFGVNAEFARSSRRRGGITCGYEDPRGIGVDRWLAMLAGWRLFSGAFVVADFGTAATLDFVDGAGAHRGGYIVPGLMTMIGSLGRTTARVRVGTRRQQPSLALGLDTVSCVQQGVQRMLTDFVEQSVARFRSSCDHRAALILTGGDAAAVSAHVKTPFAVVPDLVLDGLEVALP